VQVVKLGGSLATSSELKGWLARIHAHGGGRLVVVPGGGPFADQVRSMQARCHFDDNTAHVMALHAMDQYGLMLCGLQRGLMAATDVTQIKRILADGNVPVWLPACWMTDHPALPTGWDITSDSIAAWLAGEIGAAHLLLVKYQPVQETDLQALLHAGIIDAGFRQFVDNAHFGWSILGKTDYADWSMQE
jgi:aspartokinase-like uncharacterized kinase